MHSFCNRPMSLRSAEYIQGCQIARQTLKSEVSVIVGARDGGCARPYNTAGTAYRSALSNRRFASPACSLDVKTCERSCQEQTNPETNLP
jgi:hypothetical protein